MLSRRTIAILSAIFIMILLFGCTQQRAGPTVEPPEPPQHEPLDQTDRTVIPKPSNNDDLPATKDEPQIASDEEDEVDVHDSDQPATHPSNQDKNSTDTDDEEKSPPELATYSPLNPALLGMTIGQHKDRIKEIYGAPQEEYVMEDPLDPITVYEYDGFLIGYNKRQAIAFMDIYSSMIDPRLNGLRIGDPADLAVKVLGEPDTRTIYVINYLSHDVTLKLDLDPQSQTISSIKLFGND